MQQKTAWQAWHISYAYVPMSRQNIISHGICGRVNRACVLLQTSPTIYHPLVMHQRKSNNKSWLKANADESLCVVVDFIISFYKQMNYKCAYGCLVLSNKGRKSVFWLQFVSLSIRTLAPIFFEYFEIDKNGRSLLIIYG